MKRRLFFAAVAVIVLAAGAATAEEGVIYNPPLQNAAVSVEAEAPLPTCGSKQKKEEVAGATFATASAVVNMPAAKPVAAPRVVVRPNIIVRPAVSAQKPKTAEKKCRPCRDGRDGRDGRDAVPIVIENKGKGGMVAAIIATTLGLVALVVCMAIVSLVMNRRDDEAARERREAARAAAVVEAQAASDDLALVAGIVGADVDLRRRPGGQFDFRRREVK